MTCKNAFERLFGIPPEQVKKTCILIPFPAKSLISTLGITRITNKSFYPSCSAGNITLINSRIGAPFTGDAVLFLEETAVENLIFTGSCGLTGISKTINEGDMILPKYVFAIESFCALLKGDMTPQSIATANTGLIEEIISSARKSSIKSNLHIVENCASLGSIKLEEGLIEYFRVNKITAVEMESAAFLTAAAKIKRKAAVLLYATDTLTINSPYSNTAEKISRIQKDVAETLKGLKCNND
jgi:purine-nucleoside phosphorylase